MNQRDRNKFFEYMRTEHNTLLTEYEIERIIKYLEGLNENRCMNLINDRINGYKFINAFLMSLLMLLPDLGVKIGVLIFVLYNVISIVFRLISEKTK